MSVTEQTSRDRFLLEAALVAIIEAIVLGYLFSGVMIGGGFSTQYWALSAVIIATSGFVGAIVIYAIGHRWLARSTAARAALVVGPLIGLAIGYLLQPVGGPV
jgi:hypothetical protein